MPRITEKDFLARHAFQRLSTTELRAEPALTSAGLDTADVDNDGAIQGEPELRSLYQKLLSLDGTATPSVGVDLDAAAVKPVYGALAARFAQKTGTEPALGTKNLADVAELVAVRTGVSSLGRKDGKQLGVGSLQDALLVVAAAQEARSGQPSLLRVNLGATQQHRGLFGPGTEGAVKELQRLVGLPVTGRVDGNTLTALDVELAKARTPAPTPTPTPTSGSTTSGPILHARFASTQAFHDVLAGRVVLRAGDTGPAVQALQQALLDMGFPMLVLKNDVGVSGVDGAWGDQTNTALKNFQIFAQKRFPDVRVNARLDAATMRALVAVAPDAGKKAWDAGQPSHAPNPRWNNDATKPLRIVTVKDEHRTFLYDRQGACIGIFPNAHGTAGAETDTGLKKIRTRLDESSTQATGTALWSDTRAFGRRILDLAWASGGATGEELHGTFDYRNMGKDVSHGCVRHYNEDIITMFDAVSVGELVAIVSSQDDPMIKS